MKLPVADNAAARTYLGRLLGQNRLRIGLTLGFQCLAAICATILPWITGRAIDAIAKGAEAAWVIKVVITMVVVVVLQILVTFLSENYGGLLAEALSRQMRDRIVETVANLPLPVVERAGSGDLLGRVSYDVRQVQNFTSRGASRIMRIVFVLLVTYAAAMITIPEIGWIILVPFPFLVLIMLWYFHRVSPLLQCNAALIAQMSGQVSENAESATTIESGGLVPLRIARMGQTVRSSWNLQLAIGLTRSIGLSLVTVLLLLPLTLAVIMGALMVPQGTTTIGALTTLTMYILQVRAPFTSAMYWITNGQIAWTSIQRLAGVDLIDLPRKKTEVVPADATLQFKAVDFAYTPGKPVLQGLNLRIKPGETIAIVGTSGAGKSTLARLAAGIDRPDAGQVTMGGVEVSQMAEAQLHQEITLVTQEHHVFAASLRENLLLANPQASSEELWQALEKVEAHWARQLPDGLDCQLGTVGYRPSSAEAQQIALARLILKDPQILILDEATSMLDPSSAYALERALGRVLAGRTVLMIAHRLFTARDADRICVMEQGRIAELGTHQQLLAQAGIYARLWHAWQAD